MLRKVCVKCVHFIKQHYIYAQPTITMNNCITRIAIYSNCSCRVENKVWKQPPFHWKTVQKHRKTFQAPWFYNCQVTCHCRTRSEYMVQWCHRSSNWYCNIFLHFPACTICCVACMFLQGQLLLMPCNRNASHQHQQCTSDQWFQMSFSCSWHRITINQLSVVTLASITHKCSLAEIIQQNLRTMPEEVTMFWESACDWCKSKLLFQMFSAFFHGLWSFFFMSGAYNFSYNSIVSRITHVMSIEYFNYFLWNSTVNEPIRLLRWRLASNFL